MNNIKDMDTFLVEWKTIKNTDAGLIVDGDVAHPINDEDDIDDINQSIKRAQNDDMKKMCGGIRRFETKYENGEIKPLYDENSKVFGDIIKDKKYGYYELNVSDEDIKNIFSIKLNASLGKGEVLMSCLFPDVSLGRRKFKDDETDRKTPDCVYPGGNIEVKSCGSEFIYIEDTDDKIHNCIFSIVKHMQSRRNSKETIFVFFDNTPGNDDPKGFFWIKCGQQDEENTNDLIKILKDNMSVGDVKKKSKTDKFLISCKNKKIVIHPRN